MQVPSCHSGLCDWRTCCLSSYRHQSVTYMQTHTRLLDVSSSNIKYTMLLFLHDHKITLSWRFVSHIMLILSCLIKLLLYQPSMKIYTYNLRCRLWFTFRETSFSSRGPIRCGLMWDHPFCMRRSFLFCLLFRHTQRAQRTYVGKLFCFQSASNHTTIIRQDEQMLLWRKHWFFWCFNKKIILLLLHWTFVSLCSLEFSVRCFVSSKSGLLVLKIPHVA